jgi:hypothetical protein
MGRVLSEHAWGVFGLSMGGRFFSERAMPGRVLSEHAWRVFCVSMHGACFV